MEKPALFSAWQTPVIIETRLNRREVVQLLRGETIAPLAFFFLPQYGIVGRIGDYEAWFENRSIFPPAANRRLYVALNSSESGTSLTGQFGYPFYLKATFVGFGCFVLLVFFGVIATIVQDRGVHLIGFTALIWLALPLLWLCFLAHIGRGRELQLVEHLETLLSTHSTKTAAKYVSGEVLIRPRHQQPDHSPARPTA